MTFAARANPRDTLAESRETAGQGAVTESPNPRTRDLGVLATSGSEDSFRLIVETIPGLVAVMTPGGEVEHVNRQVLEYFGRTLEELKQWGTTDAVHPADLPRVSDAWQHAVETGLPYELEHRIRRGDGEYRWFQLRGLPLRDAEGLIVRWYVLLTDIDDRKQAEDALFKSEERWRSVFENSAIGVALTDMSGRFLATNAAYLNMLGYTQEEIGELTFLELTHEDHREANWQLVTELLEGKRQQFQIEKQYRRKDGGVIWVSNNVSLVPGTKSMPRFVMALSEDVTERKRTEEKLRQSQASVEKAFDEIKRLKDRLQDENVALREEVDQAFMFEEIVGASPALKTVLSHVSKVAPTDSTVLISGETGTGKELIARAVHKHSHRADRAFVSLNCAATPPSLIASELFGHEKGAFTGAVQQRRGRFELAHSGTIFLDEIGEIPSDTQIALLRVLQERQIERVGGSRAIPVDVRVIAATNRDLSDAIANGTFRSICSTDECLSDSGAAAQKTARGHSNSGRVLRQAFRREDGQADPPDRQADIGALREISVAWKHSRAAEYRRAFGHPV